MSKEAMKLALEALETELAVDMTNGAEVGAAAELMCEAITALKKALANQEQGEPVAWMKEGWGPDCGPYVEIYRDDEMGWRDPTDWTPLYTTPQQRTWEGLSVFEINDLVTVTEHGLHDLVERTEAKLKDKNNA
jgi:hypothetical protein